MLSPHIREDVMKLGTSLNWHWKHDRLLDGVRHSSEKRVAHPVFGISWKQSVKSRVEKALEFNIVRDQMETSADLSEPESRAFWYLDHSNNHGEYEQACQNLMTLSEITVIDGQKHLTSLLRCVDIFLKNNYPSSCEDEDVFIATLRLFPKLLCKPSTSQLERQLESNILEQLDIWLEKLNTCSIAMFNATLSIIPWIISRIKSPEILEKTSRNVVDALTKFIGVTPKLHTLTARELVVARSRQLQVFIILQQIWNPRIMAGSLELKVGTELMRHLQSYTPLSSFYGTKTSFLVLGLMHKMSDTTQRLSVWEFAHHYDEDPLKWIKTLLSSHNIFLRVECQAALQRILYHAPREHPFPSYLVQNKWFNEKIAHLLTSGSIFQHKAIQCGLATEILRHKFVEKEDDIDLEEKRPEPIELQPSSGGDTVVSGALGIMRQLFLTDCRDDFYIYSVSIIAVQLCYWDFEKTLLVLTQSLVFQKLRTLLTREDPRGPMMVLARLADEKRWQILERICNQDMIKVLVNVFRSTEEPMVLEASVRIFGHIINFDTNECKSHLLTSNLAKDLCRCLDVAREGKIINLVPLVLRFTGDLFQQDPVNLKPIGDPENLQGLTWRIAQIVMRWEIPEYTRDLTRICMNAPVKNSMMDEAKEFVPWICNKVVELCQEYTTEFAEESMLEEHSHILIQCILSIISDSATPLKLVFVEAGLTNAIIHAFDLFSYRCDVWAKSTVMPKLLDTIYNYIENCELAKASMINGCQSERERNQIPGGGKPLELMHRVFKYALSRKKANNLMYLEILQELALESVEGRRMLKTFEAIPKIMKIISKPGQKNSLAHTREVVYNANLLKIITNIASTGSGCTELIRQTAHKLPELLKNWMDWEASSLFLWEVLSLLENLSAYNERARTILRKEEMLLRLNRMLKFQSAGFTPEVEEAVIAVRTHAIATINNLCMTVKGASLVKKTCYMTVRNAAVINAGTENRELHEFYSRVLDAFKSINKSARGQGG